MKGLVIDTPHIDNILSGRKTWEMRSTGTKVRGIVALIRKNSGQLFGPAEIRDSRGPLSKQQLLDSQSHHLMTPERIHSPDAAKYVHAWVVERARALARPIAYPHPSGAVIWVNLDDSVSAQVRSAM